MRDGDREAEQISPASRTTLPTWLATSAAATAATAEAATATAAGARGHRLGLIHGQIAATKIVIVQLLDRTLSLFIGSHLDETEATSPTRGHVAHDLDALDGAAGGKELFEILFSRAVRKVPHVKFSTHLRLFSLLPRFARLLTC